MTRIIIDRRLNQKGKNNTNRQKYMRRVRDQIRESVNDIINNSNIDDLADGSYKKIKIKNRKSLTERQFTVDHNSGNTEHVYPMNDRFTEGDRIDRPKNGGGSSGKKASDSGEGEDDFEFNISQEEFLNIFFEGLELPDLVKKEVSKVDEYQYRRAGFSVDGNPARLNVVRSMKQSKSRRIALLSKKRKQLRKIMERLDEIDKLDSLTDELEIEKLKLLSDSLELKRRIKAIPFIDDLDLRYTRFELVEVPSTQAVMFCILDVSGSMGEFHKSIAKRFFMLLYLFLKNSYEKVDIIFIRHHVSAKEVSEEEFFKSKESGGTIVSSALECMDEIIKSRYPVSQWNIFGCQASDGDNWTGDSEKCEKLLLNTILPACRHFAYLQIDDPRTASVTSTDLWPAYTLVKESTDNFDMVNVSDQNQIYTVFRKLFEARSK